MFRFYALYLINRLGLERAATYVKNVPQEVVNLARSLTMDFYEKYDPNALRDIPRDFADHFLNHLQDAGIQLYTDADYAERAKVFEALSL